MTMLLGLLLAAGAAAAVPPRTANTTPPKAATTAGPVTTTLKVAARPTREQVAAAVHAEWPRYDGGAKGKLTPLEFSTWVMRSHGGSVAERAHARGISPVSAMNASATAFARADANHDGGVTPDEMTRFLMLSPAPTAIQRAKAAPASATAKPAPAASVN
jgi:hypothetical protein